MSLPPTSSHARATPMINDATSRLLDQAQAHSAGIVGIVEEINPSRELEAEDQEKEDSQRDLPAALVLQRRAHKEGPHACGTEEEADDADHDSGIPHVGTRHQAEQRNRQRIGEREERSRSPDLLGNSWKTSQYGSPERSRRRTRGPGA